MRRLGWLLLLILFTFAKLASAQDTLTIRQIQEVPPGGDISPYDGQAVVTGGVVTAGIGVYYTGAGVTFYMEDPGGGIFSGINVYSADGVGFPYLVPGDSVICQGTIMDNGMTSIATWPDAIEVRSSVSALEPLTITAADIDSAGGSDSLAERYESVFARINNLTVDSTVRYAVTSFWFCHDNTGHCIIKETSDSIPNSFVPASGTTFDFIQGIVAQSSGHFLLLPRYLRDIRLQGSLAFGEVRVNPPYPTSQDSIDIRVRITGDVESVRLRYLAGDSLVETPMQLSPPDEYFRVIGPFPDNARIDFYIMAIDSLGIFYYFPSEAPYAFYSIFIDDDAGAGRCHYIAGDLNGNIQVNGIDIVKGVAFLKGLGGPPAYPCYCDTSEWYYIAGDVNASQSFSGVDITYMVGYFKGGPGFLPQARCPSGATPPYALIKGTISWPGHALSDRMYVYADSLDNLTDFIPFSRNLGHFSNSKFELLISNVQGPRAIGIHAHDDLDADDSWIPDSGEGWGFYDANGNGMRDQGDIIIVGPGQVIEGIEITLSPCQAGR
ncbi:MAG: hypothetical protein A2W25_15880 [candidate division Zixibacteria bacterium RBG_16_53_22]|nr:MAG: hypothetical protein A2W25_15880 [candidate division Zixibacteria bacterium RBG_16_53_22]